MQPVDVALGWFASERPGHVRQRLAGGGRWKGGGLSRRAAHWGSATAWRRAERRRRNEGVMMGRGTSRRPEHENEALTPSHDGCLQVKMDAPVGLQRLARESMQAGAGACDWAPTWTFAIPAGGGSSRLCLRFRPRSR